MREYWERYTRPVGVDWSVAEVKVVKGHAAWSQRIVDDY